MFSVEQPIGIVDSVGGKMGGKSSGNINLMGGQQQSGDQKAPTAPFHSAEQFRLGPRRQLCLKLAAKRLISGHLSHLPAAFIPEVILTSGARSSSRVFGFQSDPNSESSVAANISRNFGAYPWTNLNSLAAKRESTRAVISVSESSRRVLIEKNPAAKLVTSAMRESAVDAFI